MKIAIIIGFILFAATSCTFLQSKVKKFSEKYTCDK